MSRETVPDLPELEAAECRHKAAAVLRAVALAQTLIDASGRTVDGLR